MKRIAIVIAVFSILGCAGQTAILHDFKDLSAEIGFSIKDERPEAEKETEWKSLSITSCNYGIRQIGDKDVVPDRLTILRNDLHKAIGQKLSGKTVSVKKYSIHFNAQNAFRGSVYSQYKGPIAGFMSTFGSGCKREEVAGGWFEPADVTTPFSPIIIEITVEIDGKEYPVRSVYSPEKEIAPAFGNPESASALFAAIQKASNQLVASIRVTERRHR